MTPSVLKSMFKVDGQAPLEVRVDKKLVGHWNTPGATISAMAWFGPGKLDRAGYDGRLSHTDLANEGVIPHIVRKFQASSSPYASCEVIDDISHHEIVLRLTWNYVKLGAEDHEKVFDDTRFTPVEVGPPDIEYRANRDLHFDPAEFLGGYRHKAADMYTSAVTSTTESAPVITPASLKEMAEWMEGPMVKPELETRYLTTDMFRGIGMLRPESMVKFKTSV